jgi:bifunctional non-homologous end joining protein LigD
MRQHFYKPMLAKVAEKPFSDRDWIFEIKWDGFRAVAYVEEPFSLKSRNGKELKFNFPELHQLADLANNVVVDGEIVVMQNGKPDFQRLLERGQAVLSGEIQRQAQKNPAIYVIFDVLEKDGKSLTALNLMQRKAILKDSIKEGDNVILSDFIEEKGEAYYQSALDKGLEGVVAKRKDSRYEEGVRSGNWLKMKEIKSCDCVIFGYTEGSKSRKATFGALLLGVFDKENKPIYVGKVGTGFTERVLSSLFEMFKKLKTDTAPFPPEAGDKVTWIEPELVCEVDYQVLTRDMRLRMARFKRLRGDKSPKECTIDQLIKTEELDKAAAEDKLSEYKLKRRFQETPEPKGGQKKGERLIYVIQEHHARRLHFDLRLEKDGVLKSWAVPKGIPEAGQKVLAVETEDHPYDYASFEGEIPKGQYGAGIVKIWDKGNYEAKVWENDKVEFALDGDRLKGRYILVRLKRASEKDWLLLKGKT